MNGKIRVASTHPQFKYEIIFGCEPKDDVVCNYCKYKFSCFTDEEITIVFRGKRLGIFPRQWRYPEPTRNELEKFLFGKRVYRLHQRPIRYIAERIFT